MLSKKAERERSIVYNRQQTKNFVDGIIEEYLCFAALCLDDEDYVRNIHSLLPFDNFMQARLRLDKYATPVRSLGLSVKHQHRRRGSQPGNRHHNTHFRRAVTP